jgi:8-oxo-dGTP pyrophosphatase MutT (NUDIX family)
MFIKIYFNDKPLFLCDSIDAVIEPYMHHDDAVFIDELNSNSINSMVHEMHQEKVHAGIFLHNDLEALKKAFWKKFKIIKAAGGVVWNEQEEILLIFRRGFWDLPKGKVDDGESLEECAIREVEEETGVSKLNLEKYLLTTYHTYDEGSKHILKESWWYTMTTNYKSTLSPQQEEGIEEAKWMNPSEATALFSKAYPSVRDVLKLSFGNISKQE